LLSYVGPICDFDSCLFDGLLGGHGLCSFVSLFHAQEEILSCSTTQIN